MVEKVLVHLEGRDLKEVISIRGRSAKHRVHRQDEAG